jgi:carbamoyl-phosphate synthase small subunit
MKTYLHFEDGEIITGNAFGFMGESVGEVVFTTGMSGYTESLTDPSFAGQILLFTYPLIGNYGIPIPKYTVPHVLNNFESEQSWVKGVVVSNICETPSHYQSQLKLSEWLSSQKVPGISGVDTRYLTQKLRDRGVMRGMISPDRSLKIPQAKTENLVSSVSFPEEIFYPSINKKAKHVVLIDCGVKHGIIRALLEKGDSVTRIPWDADPTAIKNIDGVVCSNGPGDPKDVPATIANIKKVLTADIPFLGICLGHQLLSLAIGADTYKLKYGHRGLNQPCQEIISKKAYVTSQNHGYAVDRKTIPSDFREWFINLNDQTNEGIRHKSKNIHSVQFHPEGDPGPFDTNWIFGLL